MEFEGFIVDDLLKVKSLKGVRTCIEMYSTEQDSLGAVATGHELDLSHIRL